MISLDVRAGRAVVDAVERDVVVRQVRCGVRPLLVEREAVLHVVRRVAVLHALRPPVAGAGSGYYSDVYLVDYQGGVR